MHTSESGDPGQIPSEETGSLFDLLLPAGAKEIAGERVQMESAIRFALPPDQEKLIYTQGLSGCTSCLFYVDDPTMRHVILSHFPPTLTAAHKRELRQLLKQNPPLNKQYIQ